MTCYLNLVNSRAGLSNTEFMQTPTPPDGYRLVKGEEIKDRVPDGAQVWTDENMWEKSSYEGYPLPPLNFKNFYAIPDAQKSIVETAKEIVAGDRAQDYGDAQESFGRIAKLWSAYTGIEITPWDVAQMMILLKVSRAKTSRKDDTLIDIAGYAECAGRLK